MVLLELLKGDPLPWLLEIDPVNPGVRYFALRELLERPEDDPEVRQARAAIMASGPVPAILAAQAPEGYWVKPGNTYSPKYRGLPWQIIFLAELGADPADERVRRGCEYLLDHSQAVTGGFSLSQPPSPSAAVHCLNGNLVYALLKLGWGADPASAGSRKHPAEAGCVRDPRLQAAIDWMVRAITGEGEVRYYRWSTSGPGFACGINQEQPCAWGANKALKALSAIPPDQRTPPVQRAIQKGVDFLFSRDPALADYPYSRRVSPNWFKFGFPSSYWSDVLETAAVLGDLGYGGDARLANVIQLILSKQDDRGRWKQEHDLNYKMWMNIERPDKPSKWITLRALRVLKRQDEKRET